MGFEHVQVKIVNKNEGEMPDKNDLKKQALFDDAIALMKEAGLLHDDADSYFKKEAIGCGMFEADAEKVTPFFNLENSSLTLNPEATDYTKNDTRQRLHDFWIITDCFGEKDNQHAISVETLTYKEDKDLDKEISLIEKRIKRSQVVIFENSPYPQPEPEDSTKQRALLKKKADNITAMRFNEAVHEFIRRCNLSLKGICAQNQIIHYLNKMHTITNNQKNGTADASRKKFEMNYLNPLPEILTRIRTQNQTNNELKADIKALAKLARSTSIRKHGHRALGVLLIAFVGLIAQCVPSLKKTIHYHFEKANTLDALSTSISLFKTHNDVVNTKPVKVDEDLVERLIQSGK